MGTYLTFDSISQNIIILGRNAVMTKTGVVPKDYGASVEKNKKLLEEYTIKLKP